MTLKEIRESGILEYYVLGQLSEEEIRKVEGYLIKFPELQNDYREIQNAMEAYAKVNAIAPSAGLEQKILQEINSTASTKIQKNPTGPSNNSLLYGLAALAILLALGALWFAHTKSNEVSEIQNRLNLKEVECDSIQSIQQQKINAFELLRNPGTRAMAMTSTPNFPETSLLFHINEGDQQNFIQVQQLPTIASNESFQLWSLKDGQAPIPLTVFTSSQQIIPVDFEQGTATYAITIEKAGGSLVPDLTKLICTVGT